MNLIDKIAARDATVSVIGLGYVGLPLATIFAEAGFQVIGIDLDTARVGSVNQGESYVQDVSSDTLASLTLASGRSALLSATTDFDALQEADVAIVCVPTPLGKTKDPDLTHVSSAADEIAKRLHSNMLIVLESTSYPGTTEELVLPRLQRPNGRTLRAGTDFYLAFSPERIDPGRTDWTISTTPKVIGGVTPECTDVARALYECVIDDVVTVSSTKVAEMVKLLENTFRATNIALVNEMAIMCDRLGVDVWEVIEATKTKPFGYMPFYPGPGLGGHCLPVDPQYLAWKMRTLDYRARFIQLADEINLGMPLYWVTKVQDALNQNGIAVNGAGVLVLGVTYKRDLADIRESPALDVIGHLRSKGARVSYHDPYVRQLKADAFELTSISDEMLERSMADADCVVIVADHSSYSWESVRQQASLVVDTRNALGKAADPRVTGAAPPAAPAVRDPAS